MRSSATYHKLSQIIRNLLPNTAPPISLTSYVLLRRLRSKQRRKHISTPKRPNKHESLAVRNSKKLIGQELSKLIPR